MRVIFIKKESFKSNLMLGFSSPLKSAADLNVRLITLLKVVGCYVLHVFSLWFTNNNQQTWDKAHLIHNTRVGRFKTPMGSLNSATLKTPFGARFGHNCYISQVIANFVLKFPNFRYHSNKGHSLVNLNVAIKSRNLEALLLGAKCFAIFYIICYILYYSQFCVKIPKLSLPWQQGSVSEVWYDKAPFVQTSTVWALAYAKMA